MASYLVNMEPGVFVIHPPNFDKEIIHMFAMFTNFLDYPIGVYIVLIFLFSIQNLKFNVICSESFQYRICEKTLLLSPLLFLLLFHLPGFKQF